MVFIWYNYYGDFMSFTSNIKNEISNIEYSDSEKMAELSAILNIGVKIYNNRFEIYTENISVARRIYKLIKEIYHVEIEMDTSGINTLRKNKLVLMSVHDKVDFILEDLSITKDGIRVYKPSIYLVDEQKDKQAYLRGVFVMCGSINDPKTSRYHAEFVISNLESISQSGNLPNLILAGPPGTGKTTSVLALAHELLGDNFKKAVIELNASDERGINVVRDKIKRFAQQKIPLPEGRHKIIILDEADSMTSSAQGSMRVTISDYSNTTRFVLACNDSSKIIEAIQSRCTVLRFGKLSSEEIKERLKYVLYCENAKYTEEGLKAIIDTCNGDMRYALNNAQSCVVGFEEINEENIYKIVELPRPKEIEKIYNFCFEGKFKEAMKKFDELFDDGYSCLEIISVFNRLIQESFKSYIKERLLVLYNDKDLSKDPKKFVPSLIELKKEMDEIVVLCFGNNTDFQDQENKQFSVLMSKDFYPKQLANYADYCLRSGFKGKSEEEIEKTLNDIISIFKNINSKLIFQTETAKKMSDRLIKGSSLLMNAEKLFISKLKQENGVTYVSKMNEMINDLEKNKVENEGYKLSKSRGVPNGIKFNVQVISQSAWDINNSNMEKIEIPPFMHFCVDDFQNFYLGKHQQHKLIWCFSLSRIEIQYLYLSNKNISTSTLPQFLALYYLEKKNSLNLEQIAQLLGCNVQKVIYDIRGLIFNPSFNPKGGVDKGVIVADIDQQTKEFKSSTQISINKNFKVNHQKFNTLPLPQKKTAAEVKASEIEEAQIIKRYQDNILQATVTRIMKSRIGQNTTHVWLVGETSKQVDLFKAQPQQIKENIEKLIEKNIIKRNGASYEYIA